MVWGVKVSMGIELYNVAIKYNCLGLIKRYDINIENKKFRH
jgi:hypothetical protein